MKPARLIPIAIAEAAASGLPPERISAAGKTFRVSAAEASRPSGYYRSRARAEAVVAAAKVVYDAATKRPPRIDKKGVLAVKKKRFSIAYELWEADELIPSHDPETWQYREDYPPSVQERDYTGTPTEKKKVEDIAKNPDPLFLLARTPTASDGAPIIAEVNGTPGIVWGGNGRTMGLQLAYRRGTADKYRAALRERAPEFGISQAAIDQAQKPVLVRAITNFQDKTPRELAALSSALNESTSNAKDDVAAAVAIARQLSPATIATIGELLEDASMREAMDGHPHAFVDALRADDIITDRNREEWMSGAKLSKAGKLRLEQAFLARAVETTERLRAMSPSLAQKVERLVPALTRVDARENGHSITQHLQAAIDAIHTADAQGMAIDEFLGQKDFTRTITRQAEILARCLDRLGRVRLGQLADAWAARADFDPNQKTLFGAHPSPAETFRVWEEAAG